MSEKSKVKKEKKNPKVFLQSNIQSSSCSGPELFYFLNCKYHGVESDSTIPGATVEELIEESFQFIMPDGVPDYFNHFQSKDNSWSSISSLMCKEFFKKDIIQWQMKYHTLDYTKASLEDLEKQHSQLREALLKSFDNEDETCVNALRLTTDVMTEMHTVLTKIKMDTEKDVKNKSLRHDNVKATLYNIFKLLGLGCKINGDAKFTFFHPKARRLQQKEGTFFTSKPDATLYAVKKGKETISKKPFEDKIFPFLVVGVYGSISDDVVAVLSESSTSALNESSDSDQQEDSTDYVTRNFKKVISQSKGQDYYEVQNRSNKKTYKRIIARESPIPCTKEMQLAFRKSTGQLPIEMYGSLLEKMFLKFMLDDLDLDRESQTAGLFIMNDRIYWERITESNNTGKSMFEEKQQFRVEESSIPNEGPKIYLAKWYFDLKIPNHRIAFQAVLYYLQKITFFELKNLP